MDSFKLSVVIPVYNERGTVREIIDRVQQVQLSKEIIIIDDGSTDGTREELARIEREHPNVKVVLQPRNMGKGRALRTGFQTARGEYVIVQDADLEYDPDDYPALVAPIVEGRADVVYGSRHKAGELRRGSKVQRTIASRARSRLRRRYRMQTCIAQST